MWEFGHMGIKTIAQNQGKLPNVLEFNNIKHAIELIKREEYKIGTIQSDLARQTHDAMTNSDDWLKIDFWK